MFYAVVYFICESDVLYDFLSKNYIIFFGKKIIVRVKRKLHSLVI